MALFDELTGLPNRSLLFDRSAEPGQGPARLPAPGSPLHRSGRFQACERQPRTRIGDILLAEVAQRLRARARESDTVARIGGDEFSVVLDRIAEP